jgi:hypothetical protein
MRALSVVAFLLLANAGLVVLRQSASSERRELVDAASTQSLEADQARDSLERRRALDALIAQARTKTVDPRDIGALRDVLVQAEQGLSIDRLSLEFRPEDRLPAAFGGSSVHASLRRRFEAIYDYLERLESMFLPLSPRTLALRGDLSNVTLTIHWAARWPLAGDEGPLELSATQVSQLTQWLSLEPRPRPDRDIFSFGGAEAPPEASTVTRAPEVASPEMLVEDPEPAAEPERPVLTGFVLARPELEPDVRRRVLAALRYEGEVRLVMVGDTIGEYVVERIEARASVTLTRIGTGERIRLTFE